jgi:recombination protein RecA
MARKSTRKHKLETAVARIHARFGPRSLVQGRSPLVLDAPVAVPHISTGFPKLDEVLSIGGLPRGKICEIVGLPTSGKTTIALKFLVQAQSVGMVAYIDQARYFDADYAQRCGIDLSQLYVGVPYNLDETLATTEALVRSESLAALVFDAMDHLWADQRAVSQLASCFNRLSVPLTRAGTVLLVVHAATGAGAAVDALDASPGHASESPRAIQGLAHQAAVRLRVNRERWIRHHGDVRGYKARVEVLKNRLGPAGRAVTIAIRFNGTVHGNGL